MAHGPNIFQMLFVVSTSFVGQGLRDTDGVWLSAYEQRNLNVDLSGTIGTISWQMMA